MVGVLWRVLCQQTPSSSIWPGWSHGESVVGIRLLVCTLTWPCSETGSTNTWMNTIWTRATILQIMWYRTRHPCHLRYFNTFSLSVPVLPNHSNQDFVPTCESYSWTYPIGHYSARDCIWYQIMSYNISQQKYMLTKKISK